MRVCKTHMKNEESHIVVTVSEEVQKPYRLTTFGCSDAQNYNLHIISHLKPQIGG